VLVAGNESSCWIHATFESLGRGIRGSRDCPGSSGSLPQSEHITKLYRSYLDDEQRHHPRHRGKLPHQITYLVRSLQRQETVLLASSLSLLEALPLGPLRAADSPGSALTRGELLCKHSRRTASCCLQRRSRSSSLVPGQFAFEQGAAAGELRRLWRSDGDGATTAAGHPLSSLRGRFYQGERSGFARHQSCDMLTGGVIQHAFLRIGDVR
jgi:hypothetical protein